MQAYHQQIANMSLPNGAASGLLIASPAQFATLQQQQQQYHQSPNSYQDLVKAYLPQLSTMSTGSGLTNSLSTSPASSSPSSSLSSSTNSGSSVANFAVRLMSLNAREINCLNSDGEFMRHIHEAQMLIENRLNEINSTKSIASQTRQNKQNQPSSSASSSSSNQMSLNIALLQQQHDHNQQLQLHQQHILMSPDNYYQNYCAQQLALSQMAQLQQQRHGHHQQHHNQLFAPDSALNFSNQPDFHALTGHDTRHQLNNLSSSSLSMNNEHLHQQSQVSAPALDLRTTPTRPASDTPSPASMRQQQRSANSVASVKGSNEQTQQHNYKKAKLAELSCEKSELKPDQQQASNKTNPARAEDSKQQYQNTPHRHKATTLSMSNDNSTSQSDLKRQHQSQSTATNKRVKQENVKIDQNPAGNLTNTSASSPRFAPHASSQEGGKQHTAGENISVAIPTAKKHKGEFDEPNAIEVAERERQLTRPDHYHKDALKLGNCACIIGSEFVAKTSRDALEELDRWRSLDIEERIKWKWDLNDLPKDIPLSDIKRFEDLRRDFSNGRADFGGASKRKPLGIRGTRQFLLMLYCLWGHPGRDDPMQQDGYCPHCFARIRTENEQSTLVRVVNHFNMKHRRGANPRLSPETRAAATTPQDHQIQETLKRVVETAVASTES